jgi:hypothetical protein
LPARALAKLEKVEGKKDMFYLWTTKKKGPAAMALLEKPEARKKLELLVANVCK